MNIGINLLPYQPKQNGGSGVFVKNLIDALSSDTFRQHTFTLFVTPNAQNKYLPQKDNFSEVIVPKWCDRSRPYRVAGEQLVLPYLIRKHKIDVLYSNYVGVYFTKTKQIVNVHDMLYKRYPHMIERTKLYYWSFMIPRSMIKSDAIFTLTNSSAADIIDYFPAHQDKIFATVAGINRELKKLTHITKHLADQEFDLPSEYILSSAQLSEHKNIHTLIDAFAQVIKQKPHQKLVLTGRKDHPSAGLLLDQIASLNLTDSVIFTGYISDEMLVSLYKGATIFVIPSYYEGFGLSVIEAQYFGVPVITSDAPALVEVGGGATKVVSANSPTEFADTILHVLANKQTQQELQKAGLANIEKYSWHQSAVDLVEASERIYQS